MADVKCPKCGSQLQFPTIQGKRTVHCPDCRHVFTVFEDSHTETVRTETVKTDPLETEQSDRGQTSSEPQTKPKAVIPVCLGLVSVFFGIRWFMKYSAAGASRPTGLINGIMYELFGVYGILAFWMGTAVLLMGVAIILSRQRKPRSRKMEGDTVHLCTNSDDIVESRPHRPGATANEQPGGSVDSPKRYDWFARARARKENRISDVTQGKCGAWPGIARLVTGILLSAWGYNLISASAVPESERYPDHQGHWCFECNKPATRTEIYGRFPQVPSYGPRVWLCDGCDPSGLYVSRSEASRSDLEGNQPAGHKGWKWGVGIVSSILGVLFFFGGLVELCNSDKTSPDS